jgi:arsenate reductase-like glutaredoxin family protein
MPRKKRWSNFWQRSFGSIFRSLLNKESEWVRQADLAKLADVDERIVQKLLEKIFHKYLMVFGDAKVL